MPTEQQALQEGAALACSATRTLVWTVGLVLLEHLLVFQVVVPVDVTGMMFLDQDQPGAHWLPLHSGFDLSVWRKREKTKRTAFCTSTSGSNNTRPGSSP